VLAAAQRLRRREDFAATIRNGRRAGRGALVVHFLQSTIEPAPADQPSARAGFVVSAPDSATSASSVSAGSGPGDLSSLVRSEDELTAGWVTSGGDPGSAAPAGVEPAGVPARAGFVVSKAVGNAVVRNLVKRRLRHLIRSHMAGLPSASMIVVRALPASATASFEDLGRDLETALTAARRPRSREGRR
jgi:ribonuclease P protein component